MVPHSIQSNLAGLRRRERLITFIWGLACWVAVVLVLVGIGGFVDWLVDRERDTPYHVRLGVFVVQLAIAAAAGLWFLVWPQLRRLPDSMLALWVEDKVPIFEHRLISAVQLNQPGARLEGMSTELVAVVTREAEKEASHVGFAAVADHDRLKRGAFILAPMVILAALPLVLWPEIARALLARQALLNVEIPRSVYLDSITPEAWPIGDKIPIRYRVRGKFHKEMEGDLLVTPNNQPTDRYPLVFIEQRSDPDGASHAVFGADVHPSSVDLLYSARLADGRTRLPSEIHLVPRPVILENQAWVQLPEYCGKRPNGERYEQPQGRGDVVGIPGSRVHVRLKIQKQIAHAWLELLGPEKIEAKKSEEDAPPPPEIVKEKLKMNVSADALTADISFDLREGLSGYRMLVLDAYGFDNIPKPRRSLRLVPEDPPQVVLLRDTFGIGADFDLEGLPVILGGRIRIPYVCYAPYGMSKANILYRVLKKHESGNEPAEEEPWVRLPLTEIKPGENAGPFDPKTGVFANTEFDQQVAFHAVKSPSPDTILGRTLGGGRYFLETKGLINSKGMKLSLKSGDQIEYCVEVFGAHRQPEAAIPVTRSESRVSTVMEENELRAWMRLVGKEDERVEQLQEKQKGVFEEK